VFLLCLKVIIHYEQSFLSIYLYEVYPDFLMLMLFFSGQKDLWHNLGE